MKTAAACAVLAFLMSLPIAAFPASGDDGTNVFTITRDGAAGDWVFVIVPFAAAPDTAAYAVEFAFEAVAPAASGGHTLYPERIRPTDVLFTEVAPLAAGETWMHSGSIGGTTTNTTRGFPILFAADVPWSLSVTITTDASAPLGAPIVNEGSGTTVQMAAELVGTHFAPVDRLLAEGSFATAGWQHAQIEVDHLQPIGVENYAVELPSVSWVSPGAMAGATVPVGGLLVPLGTFRYAGTLAGTPGDFRVAFDYAHVSQNVDAYVFEMPGTVTLPASWDPEYVRGGAAGCFCLPSLGP